MTLLSLKTLGIHNELVTLVVASLVNRLKRKNEIKNAVIKHFSDGLRCALVSWSVVPLVAGDAGCVT